MSETDALMAMANALRSDDGHTLSVRLRVAVELEALAARAPALAEVSETDELVRKKLCAAAARLEQDLRLGRCGNNFEAILAFGIAGHAEGVRETTTKIIGALRTYIEEKFDRDDPQTENLMSGLSDALEAALTAPSPESGCPKPEPAVREHGAMAWIRPGKVGAAPKW